MKKTLSFLTAFISLCSVVSCNSDKPAENNPPVINKGEVQIVDISKPYKKTEMPFPDKLQGILRCQ